MLCFEIRRDARKICNTEPIEVRARIVGSGKCLVLTEMNSFFTMAFRLDSHLYGEEKCGDAGLKFEMPCLEIRRDARKICYTKPVEVHARKCGLSLNTYNFPLLKKPGVCETS